MSQLTKMQQGILEMQNLKIHFPVKSQFGGLFGGKDEVKAVDDVSFHLNKGEVYGLVGESGSGKTTIGRSALRLLEPTSGKIIYGNQDILSFTKKEMYGTRKNMQMIFQDPYSSLNPRKTIGQILEEPLAIHSIGSKSERMDRVISILDKVGLQIDHYYRYPHEFSGGQRQRIGLARALIVDPQIIIADEPVSALDVSIQSKVINLLKSLRDELNLTYLFISHDLSVVRHISDRIGILYLGNLVEEAPTDSLYDSPLHPYTESLLSAVPEPNREEKKERIILKGEIPSPINPPSGCVFRTRCPYAMDICKQKIPRKKEISKDHFVSCHLY